MMFKEAFEAMLAAQNIAILPHKDADGDALGSAYALKLMLLGMGKNAMVIREEKEPHRLMETGVIFMGAQEDKMLPEWDLVISVDSSDKERLGERAEMFNGDINERGSLSEGRPTLCFDHHKTCTYFGKVNCVVPNAGACGEVIFDFAIKNSIEITHEIANNLYLAISSDTGGFRQSNATPESLEIGAELIRKGANSAKINTALFMSNTLSRTRLTGDVLSNLEFDEQSGICVVKVRRKQLEKFGCPPDDAEGMVNFARNIMGVNIGICFREKEDGVIKASLRSNDDAFDVSVLAEKFGGGGHARASGCEFGVRDIDECAQELVAAAEEFINAV